MLGVHLAGTVHLSPKTNGNYGYENIHSSNIYAQKSMQHGMATYYVSWDGNLLCVK